MTTPTSPSVILVDDLRMFIDSAVPVIITRSSAAGLAILRQRHMTREPLAQLWLDHDLGTASGQEDTTGPVVDWLLQVAAEGSPLEVERILVHTSNGVAASWMVTSLRHAGYVVNRLDAADYLVVDANLHSLVSDLPGSVNRSG